MPRSVKPTDAGLEPTAAKEFELGGPSDGRETGVKNSQDEPRATFVTTFAVLME